MRQHSGCQSPTNRFHRACARLALRPRGPVPPAPGPRATSAPTLAARLAQRPQRAVFRRSLAGLRVPTERHHTLTGGATPAPVVDAPPPAAPRRQGVRPASPWAPAARKPRRRALGHGGRRLPPGARRLGARSARGIMASSP